MENNYEPYFFFYTFAGITSFNVYSKHPGSESKPIGIIITAMFKKLDCFVSVFYQVIIHLSIDGRNLYKKNL